MPARFDPVDFEASSTFSRWMSRWGSCARRSNSIRRRVGGKGARASCAFDATLTTLVVSITQGVFVLDLIERRPLVRLELPEAHPYRTFVFSADGKWLFCSSRSTIAFQDAFASEGTIPVAIFDVARFAR